MTVLGKTLAVLNLILSVAVAGFIIVTYVARTNWHAAWEQQAQQTKVAQANAQAYQNEIAGIKGERDKARTDLADTQQKADAALKQAEKDVADAKKKTDDKQLTVAKLEANQASLTAEIQRRQQELNNVMEAKARLETRIAEMEKQVQQYRDSATENLIARRATEDRLDRLLKQNEMLSQEIQKLSAGGGTRLASTSTGAAKRLAPREDVEGLVTQADPDGYLTLSIGSDQGLNKGNTLEVYRLKPDPKYLGTIEVLQVQTDKAVAKPITRPNGVIQRGDIVSSNILNKR